MCTLSAAFECKIVTYDSCRWTKKPFAHDIHWIEFEEESPNTQHKQHIASNDFEQESKDGNIKAKCVYLKIGWK